MRLSAALMVLFFAGTQAEAASLDDAAKAGDLQRIEQLLNEGADINAAGPFGTALHWAALNGHSNVVKVLAERGADLNAVSKSLGTPLHAAARRDHANVARALVEAGADIESRSPTEDFTPLHQASFEGHVATALVLIEAGADVNAVSQLDPSTLWGMGKASVLHLAKRHGHPDIVAALIAAGAKPKGVASIVGEAPQANVDNGRTVAENRCSRCHIVVPGSGGPSRNPAPSLIGVAGRSIASVDGFEYSPALVEYGGEWTADRLYSYAKHPMLFVPGTNMVGTSELSEKELIDLVGYLVSLTE